MKKVYQSKISNTDGDCCRAAIASLFSVGLDDVPPFYPDGEQGWEVLKFFNEQGYDASFYNRREDDAIHKTSGTKYKTLEEVAKHDGGVNGYFYGSVKSQTFEGCTHAVIVDTDLNIVHDPNPNQLAMKLGPADVIDIVTVGDWIIDLDNNFVKA